MNRKDIEKRAQDVLTDHGLLDAVIDPIEAAHQLGIRVYNAKFGESTIAGILTQRPGTIHILVHVDDPPERKRFTIAHEIGHFLLHSGEIGDELVDYQDDFRTQYEPAEQWTPERKREWEANAFAAALLMPEELVRSVWANLPDLVGIARWFQVSTQAMAIRLQTLRINA